MLGHKTVRIEVAGRKIPQVGCYDNIRSSVDRRCQNMTIVGIGQVEVCCDGLVSGHQSLGKLPLHHGTSPVQHARVNIRPVCQKVGCPFGMDGGGPQRRIGVTVCETQQQVTKTGRIESNAVKQGRQATHCLLQTELLVASGQMVERLAAAEFRFVPVGKDVFGANATV